LIEIVSISTERIVADARNRFGGGQGAPNSQPDPPPNLPAPEDDENRVRHIMSDREGRQYDLQIEKHE
jgi:hypothetical protein